MDGDIISLLASVDTGPAKELRIWIALRDRLANISCLCAS